MAFLLRLCSEHIGERAFVGIELCAWWIEFAWISFTNKLIKGKS